MCIWNISHSPGDNWVCACKEFPRHRQPKGRCYHISGVVCLHARLMGIPVSFHVANSCQITRKCVTRINLLKKITSLVLSIVKRNVAVAHRNSALNGVLLNFIGRSNIRCTSWRINELGFAVCMFEVPL